MALKIVKGKNLPIGLDLGSHMVKMAQLRCLDGDFELIAAESAELPAGCRRDSNARLDFIGQAIRRMLSAGGFAGKKCILSLPAEATFVQHVRIPKLPPEQVALAVAGELTGQLPYPVEQAVIRHIQAGEVFDDAEPKQEIIAVAVLRSVLESTLDMACRAGLDVVGVDIEACAVVECFTRLLGRASDSDRTTLFVDMGAGSTQFVLTAGKKIIFARNLAAGGDRIDQVLAERMRISPQAARAMRQEHAGGKGDPKAEEELYALLDETVREIADEMTQCLRYCDSVFRHATVERAIFVGGQAYDKRLCQAIAQKVNLPAQIGDPLVRIRRAKGASAGTLDWRQPQPAWAVAVGLSLGPTVAA